jgi:anti-anti-sigma regulatory factor
MVLITSNKYQRLLCLRYVQRVSADELVKTRDELKALLSELPSGFRLLVDMSQLESMDPDSLTELGANMDLVGQHGVGLVVRVIPHATQDIGFNIMSVFHYPHETRTITCQTAAEALRQLALWA